MVLYGHDFLCNLTVALISKHNIGLLVSSPGGELGVGELTKSVGKFNSDNNELPNGVGKLPNDFSKLVVDNLMCQKND